MSQEHVVVARDLTRTFGAFTAVDSVSFTVSRGEIFGFLGSNGAGKTTTIRMLCGLLAPSAGTATVAGFDLASQAAEIKRHVGYMSQRFSLYNDLTVEENLRFWGGAYGLFGAPARARLEWALAAAGLEASRRELVRELPGGFRQRLALVAALLHEPPVVFLDEPTGGVDPAARRQFWDLIDTLVSGGKTVFVTTHNMDEAERCHRVALMHAGRLIGLDTVPNLAKVFPRETVLEVTGGQCARALGDIQNLPGVQDAALFGDAIHVTVDDPRRRAEIRTRLDASGVASCEVRPIRPSLEDVFIRFIRNAEREARQ